MTDRVHVTRKEGDTRNRFIFSKFTTQVNQSGHLKLLHKRQRFSRRPSKSVRKKMRLHRMRKAEEHRHLVRMGVIKVID